MDYEGIKTLLEGADETFPRLSHLWLDGGYRGGVALDWEKFMPPRGFQVLPRRWVVERTFAWIDQIRRMSKDYERLPESIEGHRERFGRVPELLTADRGLYSKANEETAKKAGIRRVALPQSGRPTKKRKEYEQQRWFRRAFAFRASVEGRISVLSGGSTLWSAAPTMARMGWDDG